MPQLTQLNSTGSVLTVSELKAFLRIDHNLEDTLLQDLIQSATDYASDVVCRRSLTATTWRYELERFPTSRSITLPRPPVQSVTHLKYYTDQGGQQSLTGYKVTNGSLYLEPTSLWPSVSSSLTFPVEVQFVAGYIEIPGAIKSAIRVLAAHWYQKREESEVPKAVLSLLRPYQVPHG